MLLIEPETDIILEANPAAVKFYGYPKPKLCGMPVSEINCLTHEQVAIECQKAKDEGRIYLVLEQRLANGRVRTVEELYSNIIWKHKPALFLIMHDITGREPPAIHNLDESIQKEVRQSEIILEDLCIHKMELEMQNDELCRIEIKLESARARYFDLYDLAPVGYCTVNLDDLIIETNLTATKLLGLTRVAMQNQPFHRYIDSGYQPDYFQSRRRLFEKGQHLGLDVEMLKKDGSHFWAHLEATSSLVSLASSELEADSPVTARIVICDISERKRTDQVLRENQELVLLQSDEKAKQAARLVIANQELVFQNEEKAKQAAELALVNSYLESLIDYANAPIIVWDPQFRITRFNHAFEFLTGCTEAEVLGQSLEILFPPAHIEKSMAQIQTTLAGEHWESVEIEILHRDASIRTLLWNSATLFEPDGKTPLATIAQGQNITRRKQAEAALRESELRYRTEFEQASNGILHLSTTGEVLDLNDSYARMHGYSVKEMQGLSLIDLDPSESVPLSTERIQRVLAGELLEFEVQHYHKDGHLLPLAVSTGLISIGANLIIQAFHRDITERKQLEQSLQNTNRDLQKALAQRDSVLEDLSNKKIELEIQNDELLASQEQVDLTRARYFDLYELAPVGYCTVSEKGLILEANLKAASLLGLTKTALIKLPFSFFIARQNQDIYYQNTRELLKTGLPQVFELQMQKKDGSTFWARLETSEALDTNHTRMLRVVISEISQLKAAEIQTKYRLKELSCLNDVSRLALNPGLTEKQLCQKVVERLIPALGYPEIAAAEIRLNGKVYQSSNFSNSFNSRLTAPIPHNNEQCGELTVCYTRAASFILPEEQNLLENIATILGLWNERKISDKDVKKLSQAVEQSPLSIFITKPDGTIEYANAHFCNLTGYSLSEIVGKNPRILQSNFTTREEYKILWDTILSGQIWEGKFLNIKKDGTLFWEKAMIAPMFDEMGRIIHFLAVKENITAQTIMENDLRQSENHNRALLDAIPDMIFRIRRDGIVLDCKTGLNDHLLQHPEKLIGTSIYDRLDESIARNLKDLINKTLRSGQVQNMNIEIKLKDGNHVFEARVKDTGNTEVVAIVRDITQQSRLEQMKTDFINRASHELRTPIATMLLMTDLLDEKMQGENADEYWDVLKSELQRERGLIEHLLNAGLLEGEQDRTNFHSLEIDELIQQAVHSFEPAAREKGISLNVVLIPADENTAPRLVQGDQNDLNLVLTNLVGNAIKFTPSGGKVSIQAQNVEGHVLISIADSGIGIPSQDLPLLFSRFFRASNAIEEEIQGTGLGLYLVRSILDKHNGRIQVTSEQGTGSRFDIWLPL